MAKTIKLSAEAFIIPNMMIKIKDSILESDRINDSTFARRLLEINNYPEWDKINTEELYMLQMWWVSTEPAIPSDNIYRHGITVDGRRYCPPVEYLPAILFKDKKEGQTFTVKIPFTEDIIFEFTVTLNQLHRRYNNFGTFEEALSIVTPAEARDEFEQTITLNDEDTFDKGVYSPRDLINYYEEVMKETVLALSRVQGKADRTLAEIPNMPVDAFEAEGRNNMEYLVREISAMLDTVKASTNRKIKTAIGKRAECDKYNALCKRYWGGEE